jgi:hypothetical protein
VLARHGFVLHDPMALEDEGQMTVPATGVADTLDRSLAVLDRTLSARRA